MSAKGIEYWRARAAAAEALLRKAHDDMQMARGHLWGCLGVYKTMSKSMREELIETAVLLGKAAHKP
jgi:hypothetical protein